MLKITPLGTRGLYPMAQTPTSGYLIEGEGGVGLLDVGSGVFAALSEALPPEKVDFIFLSHLHFDHLSDLGVYNYYLESLARSGRFSGKIKVYVKKQQSAVYAAIEQLNYFEVIDFSEGAQIKEGSFNLKFYKTVHPVPSYAICVEQDGKKIGYGGDGNLSEGLEQLIKECDITVCHAPLTLAAWSEGSAHASAYAVCKLAEKYGNRVIISHFLPAFPKEELQVECERTSADYAFAECKRSYIA